MSCRLFGDGGLGKGGNMHAVQQAVRIVGARSHTYIQRHLLGCRAALRRYLPPGRVCGQLQPP